MHSWGEEGGAGRVALWLTPQGPNSRETISPLVPLVFPFDRKCCFLAAPQGCGEDEWHVYLETSWGTWTRTWDRQRVVLRRVISRGHRGHGLRVPCTPLKKKDAYLHRDISEACSYLNYPCQLHDWNTHTGRRTMSPCLSMHVSLVPPLWLLTVWRGN